MTETRPAPEEKPKPKLDIDVGKTLAGALAAVTSAVLLSTLGVVGTLIGAALGSVAATVGTALYAQWLERSRATVRKAQELARQRSIGIAGVRRGERPDTEAIQAAAEADAEAAAATPWGERLRALPWRRIGLVSLVTFLVVVVVITVFELLAGRTVASLVGGGDRSGGTTLSRVTGNGPDRDKGRDGRPSESPGDGSGETTDPAGPDDPEATGTGGADPGDGASEAPSDEPTVGGEPSGEASGTAEPSEEPSGTASTTPTPSPTPSAQPTDQSTDQPSETPGATPSEGAREQPMMRESEAPQ